MPESKTTVPGAAAAAVPASAPGPASGRGRTVSLPTSRRIPKVDATDRKLIKALFRGLCVLEAFTVEDVWLSNKTIAERTGLPKPTVSRLASTLTSLGYLRCSPRTRQYRLGMSVLALGYAAVRNSDVRTIARPYLQEFADRYNSLVGLGARDRLDIIHLETFHSNSTMLTLRVDAGSRARLVRTAFGRALMAVLPAAERELLMAQAKERHRKDWSALEGELRQAFRQVETSGFCIVKGLWQPDINAVAVPLVRPGAPPLAIGCAGDARQLTIEHLETEIGPALLSLSRRIAEELRRRSG